MTHMRTLIHFLFIGLLTPLCGAERLLQKLSVSVMLGKEVKTVLFEKERRNGDFVCSFVTDSSLSRPVGRLSRDAVLSLEKEWTECAKIAEMPLEPRQRQYSLNVSSAGSQGEFSRRRRLLVTDSAFQNCLKHTVSLLPQLRAELKMNSELSTAIQRMPVERLRRFDLIFVKGTTPEFVVLRFSKDRNNNFQCSMSRDLIAWTELGSCTQLQAEEIVDTWEKFLEQMAAGARDGELEQVVLSEHFENASYWREFDVDWRPDSTNLPNPISKLDTLLPGLRAIVYGARSEPNK